MFIIYNNNRKFAIWEVPRDEQFSPLKNGLDSLKDCPKTARDHLLLYHKKLAKKAGAHLVSDSAEIEISPLISYAGEVCCLFLFCKYLFGINYNYANNIVR